MQKSEFTELSRILKLRAKTRILYWLATIVFFVGFAMTEKYNMAAIGTETSLLPGIVMFVGAGIYFGARYFIK